MDNFLSVEDYAKIVKVSTRTVYRLIKEKKVFAFKVRGTWRIHEKDIDRIMTEHSNLKGNHELYI